jgi:hypothetical protein
MRLELPPQPGFHGLDGAAVWVAAIGIERGPAIRR